MTRIAGTREQATKISDGNGTRCRFRFHKKVIIISTLFLTCGDVGAFSYLYLLSCPHNLQQVKCNGSCLQSSFLEDVSPNDDYDDDDLDLDLDPDKEEEIMLDLYDNESDWAQAELTLLNAPNHPHPDMDAFETATLICRSLQFVDYPITSSGLERCFEFFTLDCRAAVTARQGARSVERFIEYGQLAPALQPFMGATRVQIGEATFTEAKPPLRGALCSFPVTIEGAPILAVQHPSGMTKGGVSQPPITNMVMRLEQQRRPPNQYCWMVREILDVRMAFAGDMGNVHVGG
jgi:hypothetical protein